MKTLVWLLFATSLAAQSPEGPGSYTAGRFVAYNYGQWSLQIYSFPSGTGSKTFTVVTPTVQLPDGRKIMPFNTNAPIFVGTEQVTPSAISGCTISNPQIGVCSITATFSNAHTTADVVRSATYGLQEALNDAGILGGIVTIDGSWALLGGTTQIKSAATIPSSTAIEDVRSSTGGSVTVASGALALATSAISSGACQTVTQGSVNSAAATGVLTTDAISFTPNGSIKAVTGYVPSTSGGLTITAYPTANFVNFDVCNWTSGSVTPGAVTLNWRVVR